MNKLLSAGRLAAIALSLVIAAFGAARDASAQPTTTPWPSAGAAGLRKNVTTATAPKVGDDPAKVEAYLSALRDRVASIKAQLGDASHDGSTDELDALQAQIHDASQTYLRERDRLQPEETEIHSEAMTVVGGVLTGVGGVGVIVGAIVTPFTLQTLSGVYVLGPSALLLAVGIPILAVGAHEVPREPSDRHGETGSLFLQVGPAGVALAGSF